MVRVKICGITSLEDARAAVDAGADAIGFVFYEKSPRFIDPDAAAAIIRGLPPFVCPVGVFVNESTGKINGIVKRAGLLAVQLHGDEGPEAAWSIEPPARVIKAVRVKDGASIEKLAGFLGVSAFLLDTFHEKLAGGTGATFDWNIAIEAKRFGRIILSGGLGPDNVRKAVEAVGPYGVDVSSGVEKGPGLKDHDRIRKFIAEARSAGARRTARG